MKPLTCAVSLAIALTGCLEQASAPSAPAVSEPAPAASPGAGPAIAPPTADATHEFAFGVKVGDLSKDARFVRWEESPCGEIAVVKVDAIPQDDPSLRPDPVVEFDAAGKEIARWGKPYESEVVGFDGGRMRFKTEAGSYWTDAQGAVTKSDDGTASDVRTAEGMFDCPKLPSFSESGAEQCFKVKDAAGNERRFAIEGVCS